MFKLITPTTDNQLNKYFHFRWQMLREPWRMPIGSERDEYDSMSHHRMIVDSRGYPMAIGRLYITPDCEGQIRYMAVKANRRSKGMGSLILVALESLARQEGAKRLVCNAREDAIPFYAKNGFERRGELTDERGPVRHQQMVKTLDPMANVLRKPEWCTELQDRWGKHIPISDKMGIKIQQYTGYQFQCCAQLNPNLNPHNTLFAGSAFTLATLTGWGMAWLLMRERDLQGDIVLVDSHIRYRHPVVKNPVASTSLDGISGDLDRLESGRKARIVVRVIISSGEVEAIEFIGTYMLIPNYKALVAQKSS
ncbi:TPA: YiiD C-terminal domain-containing protein [Vibrio cholerae]|uniref:bifunctional GNAT family N-acetyltransferase/hotdog fold thioesterase n=1 Tax=Vibrio cholerae TaxID=666 RepID=UPI0002DD9B8D|nr:bifunctional GNAT family N-acetyltransferase/hotdog fold thioesterase [Vibrio cholerae]EJL6376043.1 YiiD C-terminal domain-containing protein [Vibrio cholerae]ELI3478136.1 YiiD C-terminal domain-containing protein [Vibrio cholerae]ELL7182642.1 YiiD C-terminal domain-containing protein [Vibrio cholerae]MDV2347807.1 bifunctional GNAT family N-acetyltransferase/hotdog fold thioesterase [Vibrio cholerae]HDZ9141146.1 YiiD C-terminal domain-containing protein [Vibrio cholerae]